MIYIKEMPKPMACRLVRSYPGPCRCVLANGGFTAKATQTTGPESMATL
jgi:hypothetical protein